MSSPRRSPRFKVSPKPDLPQKPLRPKRVQDPAADSVRQANYQVELAEWEAAKLEHDRLMQKRKAKKNAATTAAWKAAQKGAAEKDAPPPAAPQAALAPPPQLSADEARLVGSPALAEGQELAAVERPPVQQQDERFRRLRRNVARWLLDVEAIALRCGAGEAQLLFGEGEWYDILEHGGVPGLVPHPAPTLPEDVRACCRAGSESDMWP